MALEPLRFPPFTLDPANACLWHGPKRIPLTPKDFAVLHYLVAQAGRLVSQPELLRAVWPDTVVSGGILKVRLRRIRQALGDKATQPTFIETIHGLGYRFIGKVVSSQHAVGSSPLPPPRDSGLSTQHSSAPTPNPQPPTPALVGRDTELTQLQGWFDKALSGERQMVFVTGEPGIGKTSLVEAFLAEVGAALRGRPLPGQPHGVAPTPDPWITHGQCIDQHGAGEAFLPVLDALGRLVRGAGGAQLLELLCTYAPMWLVQLPALIAGEEVEALQRKVQGASRERMLRELAEMLEVLTINDPLILVLEDLHWSDVSTLDLLAFMARRKEPARLLVIGTYRPVEMLSDGHPLQSMTQELYAHRLATELPLGVLSEADIAAYLTVRLQVPSPLKGEGQGEGERARVFRTLAPLLHHRTGGNPLFLVSTVDELVAQGKLTQTDSSWTLQGEVADVGIAESIRHLVVRQRGRLAVEERQTLEAASVAGMEFSAAAVAAALTSDTATVERRCEQLAERQQFLKRLGVEEWPDGTLAARYGFLHALHQQLWHERVTPTQLQRLHLQIGERKERAYGDRAREIVAELAMHFEQSHEYERAVRYLHQAGTQAIQRSAYSEAHSLASKGLALLPLLPASPQRAQMEMTLHVVLAVSVMTAIGGGGPEVGQACYRALELSRQADDDLQVFPILSVLFGFYFVRAQFQTAREVAERLLRLAEQQPEPLLKLAAHLTLAVVLWQMGELPAAHVHLGQRQRLYSPHDHLKFLQFGHDPTVTSLTYAALVLWLLGYPEQARRAGREAVALAAHLAHPYTHAVTLHFVSQVFRGLRELPIIQAQTEAHLALSREQDFREGIPWGMIMQGWIWVHQGHAQEGIGQIRDGIALCDAVGTQMDRSHHLAVLAEAYALNDQPDDGLAVLEEALQQVEKTGGRYYEAEIYRLKGELLLAQEGSRPQAEGFREKTEEAEACFLKAIEIARHQSAKSWELRATVNLARLWQQQGKQKQAHKVLSNIYNWFTEGFDTADLQEAKTLIEELSTS